MNHDFEYVENLREALRFSSGNSLFDSVARGGIRSEIIGEDIELQNVYAQETGPQQAVLDLHLGGSGVDGHTTNAAHFGKFIVSIAEAVKETAKAAARRERFSSDLLIEGAAPGSVRLVLRAPDPESITLPASELGSQSEVKHDTSTVQSSALRQISRLLNLASVEDSLENSTLDAGVSDLPIAARTKLNVAMQHALAASWDIEGNIEQRNFGIEHVALPRNGAAKLKVALSAGERKTTKETLLGTIDGLKYSTGTVWFEPESRAGFSAAVSDEDLLQKAATLMAESKQQVIATFKVTTISDPNKSSELRKSRSLIAIQKAAPVTFPFNLDDLA